MSDSGPIRVFVSHLFEKHPDYLRVFEYLESREEFLYLNVSNPDRKPQGGSEAIKEELRSQIKASEVMILPVTIFELDRGLVTFQMDCAGAFGKPIIGVKSFGETVVIQKTMLERVADIVEWDARALVDALRLHARHEKSARWDVVDFKLD
ncbi:MAG: nucleoside 2-deoxyribosyltransferase [Gammaproteobacteria bacterium]|nr:nucleoside 2-deoxyribosyltransferase [Gammaproteobacteria bacterium]MDH5275570.1 nucleoside 2-deoxyribosyltransferase [Gammaproteobacteria bacterium]